MSIVWDWPKDKMLWFFWDWRPSVMSGTRGWRVGPITVWIDD